MHTLLPGQLVANRYLLERELGAGASGSVWLARDTLLDSPCALKLVQRASDGDMRASFLREAMAAARIRCANVVTIFDYGEWRGLPYIAMENLEGETLDARLARVHKLTLRGSYKLVVHVARGLVRAHSLGIVHRDLKPANIFLTRADDQEVCKILDFGIAKQDVCVVPAFPANYGEGVGTPYYVSPEQARSEPVDYRADLWSFAAIACECLTGHPPFVADSVPELLWLAANGPIPRLSERDASLPVALDAWLARALSRDPSARFTSAKELADSFAAACGVEPLAVPSLSPRASSGSLPEIDQAASITLTTAQALRPRRLWPRLLAAAAAAAAALAVWLAGSRAPERPAPPAPLPASAARAASSEPRRVSEPAAPAPPTSSSAAPIQKKPGPASSAATPLRARQHWRYDPGF